MKHADDAMYQSKGKGGNCVTVFAGEQSYGQYFNPDWQRNFIES
jgi:hypothetical protein